MSKYYKETAAIKVEPSRFSALKIENDNDDDSFASFKTSTNAKSSTSAVNNAKNKKKKQTNQANDAKNKQKQFESTNWDTWKQKDEEVKYTIYILEDFDSGTENRPLLKS